VTDPDIHARAERAERAVRSTVGPNAVIREATPDVLLDALLASAAVPVAFDPVMPPDSTGSSMHACVDGGVTANTPIGVARAAARNVDVVMLDPPAEADTYDNAIEIGLAVFGAMQRRILIADVRSAYLESLGKRTLRNIPPAALVTAAQNANLTLDELMNFQRLLYSSHFFVIRPAKVLPVPVGGFDDRENLFATYVLGFEDAKKGFEKFDFSAFGA